MPDLTPPKPASKLPVKVHWVREVILPLVLQFGCGAALALGLLLLFRST